MNTDQKRITPAELVRQNREHVGLNLNVEEILEKLRTMDAKRSPSTLVPVSSHLNVEIKAKYPDLDHARAILKGLKADYRGTDHQTDTYFFTTKGRLKLRVGDIENCLVYYDRENLSGPKASLVTLYQKPSDSLKEFLVKALGVEVVVSKKREIYFIGNVKIHLDMVKGLHPFSGMPEYGSSAGYVEVEAINNGAFGAESLRKQCEYYMDMLGVQPDCLIDWSYSDLLLKIIEH